MLLTILIDISLSEQVFDCIYAFNYLWMICTKLDAIAKQVSYM